MISARRPRYFARVPAAVILKSFLRRGFLPGTLLSVVLLFPVAARAAETVPTPTNDWATPIGTITDSSPAVAEDGSIYFGTWTGVLWALKADGSTNWTFRTGREIKSSPAVGPDGTVYVGSRDHKFYAVSSSGKKKWEFPTGGWVDSSPAVAADGTVHFGSWDKNLYAVRPDGSKAWQFPTAGPVVSSPAIDTGRKIYFGSHDGKVYALTHDGRKAWEFTAGAPIISSPALDRDGTIYITSVNGWFYALNPNGTLKWRLRTGGITESSPVIGQDGTLYVGVNKDIWLISPAGQKKGAQLGDGLVKATPAAFSDGSVCFVSGWGWIISFLSPGNCQWKLFSFENRSASPAAAKSGTIYLWDYLPEQKPRMFALHAAVPLARSAWPKFRGNPQNTGRPYTPAP